ncbi:MAG: hypothetical protein WBE24_12275, partial [Candidatus Acidiferrum sp.]
GIATLFGGLKNGCQFHARRLSPLAAKVFPERQYLFRQHAADAASSAEAPSYNGIRPLRMRCPKCQFDHPLQTTECLKCGIVFSRYKPPLESAANQANPDAPVAMSTLAVSAPPALAEPAAAANDAHRGSDDLSNVRADARTELQYRIFALPAALLLARLVAGTGLRMAAAMLAMVLHESGHAITAWLTGRWAVPLLWVTPHGDQRSWLIVLLVTAVIGFAGFLAWQMERPGWLLAAAALLLLQLVALSLPAGALIVFFGDGGALVLATLLMATFYAPRESRLYKSWGLRWGLLVIGALSFIHVFLMWRGPIEDLPFGEIEGVNLSDPSLLTEMYGWTALQMVDRYVRLGTFCLLALLALYIWGLVSAYLELRRSPAA